MIGSVPVSNTTPSSRTSNSPERDSNVTLLSPPPPTIQFRCYPAMPCLVSLDRLRADQKQRPVPGWIALWRGTILCGRQLSSRLLWKQGSCGSGRRLPCKRGGCQSMGRMDSLVGVQCLLRQWWGSTEEKRMLRPPRTEQMPRANRRATQLPAFSRTL